MWPFGKKVPSPTGDQFEVRIYLNLELDKIIKRNKAMILSAKSLQKIEGLIEAFNLVLVFDGVQDSECPGYRFASILARDQMYRCLQRQAKTGVVINPNSSWYKENDTVKD